MKTLREYIKEADEKGVALGHLNFSNLEGLHAIYSAAKKLNLPVVVGLSEGEAGSVGKEEGVALVRALRERDDYPIFLNADHHHTFEDVKKCIDVGYDMVIIDGTELSFEDNVKVTKQCVDYAKKVNEEKGTDVLVEGELGFIGSGSIIRDTIPEGAGVKTKPEDAEKFVKMTGVDLFSPSVGNIHGIVRQGEPHTDPELIKEIRKAAGVPLVLHGGSGLSDEDFVNAIKAGISMVHINTEIRVAFTEGLRKSLADNPDETTPYKVTKPAQAAVERIVEARLKLFSGMK